MWRLLYSPHKISAPERQQLSASLDDHSFTCGASLSALNLDGKLSEVCVRELKCYDPVEKLYYSMKYVFTAAAMKTSWRKNYVTPSVGIAKNNLPPIRKSLNVIIIISSSIFCS
jgi:hypothetical protein